MKAIYLVMQGCLEGDVIHWCPYIACERQEHAYEIVNQLETKFKNLGSPIEVCVRGIDLVP